MSTNLMLESSIRVPTIVFDIGGTWYRSAIAERDESISNLRRERSISYLSESLQPPDDFPKGLLKYLVSEAGRRRTERDDLSRRVAVSIGAALDHRTGIIWNSGPLWGERRTAFDLSEALRLSAPDLEWTVVNDVTASLLTVLRDCRPPLNSTIVFITVSSGIAARSWSPEIGGVPVDDIVGLQGEIGHVPVSFIFRGSVFEGRCACGGASHLNAFTSGRGLDRVLLQLADAHEDVFEMLNPKGEQAPIVAFGSALARGCPLGNEILRAVIEPLARIILVALSMEPRIAKIFIGGGVTDIIGRSLWRDTLIERMEAHGVYIVSESNPKYLRELIEVIDSREAGLKGAACAAWGK